MTSRLAALVAVLSIGAHAQIVVAAAANVKPAMEEILPLFQKTTGTTAKATYGSSGKFATQIRSGAPFDVFVAADVSFPDSIVKWGFGAGKPVVYARGIVVLWTSIPDLDPSNLSILGDPRVRKVAIADPKLAPYGRNAMAALGKAGLADAVKPKAVWGENIGQVATYAATGAVDAAFPAKSQAIENLAGKGRWADVDTALAAPLPQAVVVLKYGKDNNPKTAKAFADFLVSPAAREIWKRNGYLLP
jgi:molybdate transport system substrate-binding protein